MTSKIMWFCDSTGDHVIGDHVILDVTGDHVILWHHRRSCDSMTAQEILDVTGDHVILDVTVLEIMWLYDITGDHVIFTCCVMRNTWSSSEDAWPISDSGFSVCVCVCVCVREREDRRRNQWRYKLISTRRDRIAAPGRWLCQSAGDFDCMSKAGSYHLHVYLTWERHQVTRGRWKHPSNKDPFPQHF